MKLYYYYVWHPPPHLGRYFATGFVWHKIWFCQAQHLPLCLSGTTFDPVFIMHNSSHAVCQAHYFPLFFVVHNISHCVYECCTGAAILNFCCYVKLLLLCSTRVMCPQIHTDIREYILSIACGRHEAETNAANVVLQKAEIEVVLM